MDDDFRITLELEGEGLIDDLLERFRAGRVEHQAERALGGRVVISRAHGGLIVYAASAADARAGEAAVRGLLDSHDLHAAASKLERWHPTAEEWEDADLPLPATEAEREAERDALRASEREDSRRVGYEEWEVRIELADRTSAETLSERLAADGVTVVRRSHYLLVGAASQEDAKALAERLRGALPPGARLEVQGSLGTAWQVLRGYAVFGPPAVF